MQSRSSQFTPIFFIVISTAVLVLMGSVPALSAEKSSEDHVGEITVEQLLANYPVFLAEFNRYQPTQLELEQFSGLAAKDVTALFGTWCHDSEREVPRFLKLLDRSSVELNSLRLIAVDREKKEEEGVAQSLDLKYTPTFIVHEAGNEVARIIETPKENLAADFSRQLAQ